MISIKGWQKTSLIDYPGKICSVIFLPKCNFRCPYCQNPDLVLTPEKLSDIPEQDILNHLDSKRKWIDGICITGGEPCLSNDLLPEFIRKVKNMGMLVKLDTNGSNPTMLRQMVNEKLLDYIAMDIKAPPEKYRFVTRSEVDISKIKESIKIIVESGVEYEFRTTIAPDVIEKDDIVKIGEWLNGAKKYVIQSFRPNITLDKSFQEKKPYPPEKLREFADSVRKYFGIVEVRDQF